MNKSAMFSCLGMETRLIFHDFFTSQTLKCTVSQSVSAKPCGFIWGTHVLSLNVTGKFHYLSSRRLKV